MIALGAIGSLIGGVLGLIIADLYGVFVGAIIGYKIERWLVGLFFDSVPNKEKMQEAYFEALFTTAGKMAKIDGKVSESEVFSCEQIMVNMQLNKEQRRFAIELFDYGKQKDFDITPYLVDFKRNSGRRSFAIKKTFLEMLLKIATVSDGINQDEWKLLQFVCQHINFPQQSFVSLVKMSGYDTGENNSQTSSGSSSDQQRWKAPSSSNLDPYSVLGVNSRDSKTVIKRAYKKLMNTHHPDKLIARGLPPTMIELAKIKTQNIQAAWEDIRKRQGF